jgi:hypothetical protein
VVAVRGGVGWFIDEAELLGALPDAMKAACQVTEGTRKEALDWLDQAIVARGGEVDRVWRERGKSMRKVSDLLLLSRTRLVLRRADEWVRSGRCPFWLEASSSFAGVHTMAHRLVLTVEGGGRFTQEFALGSVRYGGGGSGRVLLGYGLTETLVLSAGPEFGGGAVFTNLQLGEQSEFPRLVGMMALPVVARWHRGLSAHGEIEVGPMGYIDQGSADPVTGKVNFNINWGIRFGAAVGGSYLRLQRGMMPKFDLSFTVDYLPAVDGQPALTQIGFGARTGIDFSSWY